MGLAARAFTPGHLPRVRAALWLAALVLLPALACAAATVPVLRLHGAVDPASADYLVRGIRQAAADAAPLVVIELDTPGGLDASMRQIIQAILRSPVPVATYVTPQGARAASAGTYILYASHVAAMAPATTLGAATPVSLGFPGGMRGEEPRGAASAASSPHQGADAMTAKQVHDAAAFIRGLAQLRGRNAEWAERAVREAVTLTASEALQSHVVDVVAKDLPDLLAQVDGRSVHVQGATVKLATAGAPTQLRLPDWRHRLLSLVANPSVALILMMLGVWGLFFEFAAPGHAVSGVTGAICLLLGAFALQLLPVNYAGLALIVLGLGLMVAELFAPTFGVLGVGGVAALAVGGLMLFDVERPGYGVPVPLVLGLALVSAAVVALGAGMALKTRGRPVVSGREHMVGATGCVLQAAPGEAWAEVMGERWKVSSSEALAPGQRVRVLGLRGLTLQVRPEPDPDPRGGAP